MGGQRRLRRITAQMGVPACDTPQAGLVHILNRGARGSCFPPRKFKFGGFFMCCNGNFQTFCGCGCGCGCSSAGSSSCGCSSIGSGCNGGNNGITILPSYPDWEGVNSGITVDTVSGFPVYVSLPGRLTGGSANLAAAVNVSNSGCPFARG